MNFFAYRLPDDTSIHAYKSHRLLGRANGEGFVISPFSNAEDGQFTIPADTEIDIAELDSIDIENLRDKNECGNSPSFPERSISKEEHAAMVEKVQGMMHGGALKKAVIAKTIVKESPISLSKSFQALSVAYPHAFIFCFHTPQSGTWIGASPERLLSQNAGMMRTMALAGTRPAGSEGEWDAKNIEEQRIVRDFILDEMRSLGIRPQCRPTETRKAGPVEHLCNEITALILADYDIQAERLLRKLSPTPALAGYPKDEAVAAISTTEPFERGYYGGYCGPRFKNGNFAYFVNLRSLQQNGDRICLYSGGGILPDSNPESEWEETERKSQTLLMIIETTP